MSLAAGATLGPYEILGPIGAGGMGEVYKARDTRLDRIVAVKILKGPQPERFISEARSIAALNHPHICTLHDIGPDYLVMEYIEGGPLKGPLPLDAALRYGIQICEGLEAAHRKGIIHLDLKPTNILVTRAGVKLLDFGLAKPVKPSPHSNDTTQTLTSEDTIEGTPQYMAPEQLEGKPADARTDIWAFGAVLYEIVTGRKAFEGSSRASTIAAIMEREPPLLKCVESFTPPVLERVVKKCLAKDPDDRWQSARDLRDTLIWIASGMDSQPAVVKRRRWLWPIAVAGTVSAFVLGWAFDRLTREPLPERSMRFTVDVPEGTILSLNSRVAVSPDSRILAFSTQRESNRDWQLYLRPLDTLSARLFVTTGSYTAPLWWPDSQSIVYISQGSYIRQPINGGPAQNLGDSKGPVGFVVNRHGTILRFQDWRIYRSTIDGGPPEPVTPPMEGVAPIPLAFLDDGRHFLYSTLRPGVSEPGSIYAGSIDPGSKPVEIVNARDAAYAPGHLVYLRDRTLVAQRFDESRLTLIGDPMAVAEDVNTFSTSSAVLAYGQGSVALRTLTWVNRSGGPISVIGEPGNYRSLNISPQGDRAAVSRTDQNNTDIWVVDLTRAVSSRVTFDPGIEDFPVWSPDGEKIAYTLGFPRQLMVRNASGTGDAQRLGASMSPTYWSAAGLFFTRLNSTRGSDLWMLSVSDRKEKPFLQTSFNEVNLQVSPSGKWVAYTSNESGRNEIYVRPFSGDGKWLISQAGGSHARWSADSHELFYEAHDRMIMAVNVKGSGTTFDAGVAQPLFRLKGAGRNTSFDWAVAADGKRFLVLDPVSEERPRPIVVVVNWQADLK